MVERLGKIDAIFYTTPCYDNTPLKLLNNYGTTPTADIFLERQLELTVTDIVKPDCVLNEMVLPSEHTVKGFQKVEQGYRDMGYFVSSTTADASLFGAASAAAHGFPGLLALAHSHVSVRVLPVGISVSH